MSPLGILDVYLESRVYWGATGSVLEVFEGQTLFGVQCNLLAIRCCLGLCQWMALRLLIDAPPSPWTHFGI